MSLASLKIGPKISLGIAAICVIFAVAAGIAAYMARDLARYDSQVADVRAEALRAVYQLDGNAYRTLARVTGYILDPTPETRAEIDRAWKLLDSEIAHFDALTPSLVIESRARWQEAKSVLSDMRQAQQKAIAPVGTADAQPAMKLLVSEAAPRAATLFRDISAMIDEENNTLATQEGRNLLKTMSDARGHFTAANADLRHYVVTGDAEARKSFETRWTALESAFAALGTQRALFNGDQAAAFARLNVAFAEYSALPKQMIALREGAGWNVPLQVLTAEVAPLLSKFLDQIEGVRQPDGIRAGGIVAVQAAQVQEAAAYIDSNLATMTYLQGLLLIVGLATGTGVAFAMSRAIAHPVREMAAAIDQVTRGNLSVQVAGLGRKDEIGDIAASLLKLKDSLAEAERLRQSQAEQQRLAVVTAQENTRIKVALDSCSTNVMVADNDLNIVYMNDSVIAMMRKAESDLRKDLPQFDSNRLLGANIDIFHKNPAHQRGMLEKLSSTYQTSIKVGGRTFNLIANPVRDEKGSRLGSVVEWMDVTAEKAVEFEIDALVNAAAAGNFRERISLDGKEGFMRNLADAMNRLCSTTAGALDEVIDNLKALSDGDLTRRVRGSYAGMFKDLKDNLNTTSERLNEIVSGVMSGANEVTAAASEIADGTSDLSRRTEQQASSLEETAASMEQMSSTIKQNAENASQANHLAISARSVAAEGGEVVGKAVHAMSRIEESSQKISDIIGVIDEIAFQTNLLALNAAVEAARAGDAGKGFAVVASEVRSLAQRSSAAAKDIKGLIVESGGQVKDGVKLVHNAGSSLSEIVESIKRVADIISEIAGASREQSTGVEEINKAVAQMDEMTQQNSALVEENAAACRMLQEQAQHMQQRMASFTFESTGEGVRPVAIERARGGNGRPAAVKSPARKVAGAAGMQAALQANFENDSEWKEF